MRRVLVCKHVAQENLGGIKPLLKSEAFRIRYVNFGRDPEARPSLERTNGLIVLGGWMGVYEADRYSHIKVECALIEAALKKDIPVLGICLGAQILAHTLGANVRKHDEVEAGWSSVETLPAAASDPLLGHFSSLEKVFQMHGDTFDLPLGAVHLAKSKTCGSQAFRYGDKAYGLQFHLEADAEMIRRFLRVQDNRADLARFAGEDALLGIERDTDKYLPRSTEIGQKTFPAFLQLFDINPRSDFTRSAHGKPKG